MRCNFCGEEFATEEDLKDHLEECGVSDVVGCKHCGSTDLDMEESPDIVDVDKTLLIADYWCNECEKRTGVEYRFSKVI